VIRIGILGAGGDELFVGAVAGQFSGFEKENPWGLAPVVFGILSASF
jgi:hypothetical protein